MQNATNAYGKIARQTANPRELEADLLLKAETDDKFYRALKRECARFAPLVKSAREMAGWRRLLREVA